MPNHRLIVRNIRQELYGRPSDIVRNEKVFPSNTLCKVDVTEREYFAIKVCKSLKIESDEVIKAIRFPRPEVIQNIPVAEDEDVETAEDDSPKLPEKGAVARAKPRSRHAIKEEVEG